MISVGSRDVREGIGLGFGAGGDMEESELEEGEAYYDDSTIDPDITLSYIDEKLQDVLGHFQKDFEGGVVSAENLGAKFGGYGSFLPTYQRSPVCSRSKTPPKVHNTTPRSPNNLRLEGGHHNSVVQSSASLSMVHISSANSTLLPSMTSSVNNSSKRDVGALSARCAEESASRCALGKNYAQLDRKTLRVRIKVGSSDNLSTGKNADIYSGLGLDNSPSPSLDESPTNSEGMFCGPLDTPDKSPRSILQIMTSFPVQGNLLSPLPEDLIYLTENEKLQGESKPRRMQKVGQESSNGSDSVRSGDKVLRGRKTKSVEENVFPVELKNQNNDTQIGISVLLKKETDIDNLACEELVANALKLPLLSKSYSNVVDSVKGIAKGEALEVVSAQEIGLVEKPSGQSASAGKVWENKKANFQSDVSVYPRKEGDFKGEKADIFAKADSNVSSGRKARNTELMDPLEHKASKKATSHEEADVQLVSGKDHSSSEGKKKPKGSQNHGFQGAEIPKDSSKNDSSLTPIDRKNTNANNCLSKSEVEGFKLQKDHGKARNAYRDIFGDIELEQGDNNVKTTEMLSTDRPKDFEAVEKSTFAFNSTSKGRLDRKKTDKLFTSEAYSKSTSNAAPITGNGPISDAAPGTAAPLVKEDWVCCDKCQKWRLLPVGTNPESLPEKWLCSMLDWLPGMNSCSISEEETTKALITYQFPAPERQSNQHGYAGGVQPGLSLADANCQYPGLYAVPCNGKKKNGIKDVSAAMNLDSPAHFSNSMKKNIQASVKSKKLTGVNLSSPANKIENQHLSKSSVLEKHRHKPKEKNKQLECHSDGGEIRSLKNRSKSDTDQDCYRVSKKSKVDGMHHTDEDWMPDHDGPTGKVGPGSSSSLSVNASGKGQQKYNDNPRKDRKCEAKNSSKGSLRYPKDQVLVNSDDGFLHMENFDNKDVVRKRKMNESQDTMPLLIGRDFLEETSENNHRKEKKARISKSDGKENSISKGSGGASIKGRSTKDQQLGPDLGSNLSQRSLDAMDSLRRDLGSVQPSQAATSSSSKVSGSHKNKNNPKEVKGSPVESVSSSPLRFLKLDKSASTRRSLEGKDDSGDAGLFALSTPKRCLDGEDNGGGDRSGTVRKDEMFVSHYGSLESSVLDHHFSNGDIDTPGNGTQYPCKPQTSDQCHNEKRGKDKQYHANVSRPRMSEKGSSLWSKEKNGNFQSELDKGEIKISDSCNESIDHTHYYEEKLRAGIRRVHEKFGASPDIEKNFNGEKESAGKVAGEKSKRKCQSEFGVNDGLDIKVGALSSREQKQNVRLDHDERSSKRHLSDKTDCVEVSGRGKSHSLPPSGRVQHETVTHSMHLVPGSQKENGANSLLVDPSKDNDALKAPKQTNKSDNLNENQPIKSRHPTTNGHMVKDVDASGPVKRDSFSQAATNAVKEAKKLKHTADRIKNSGSNAESTGLYFQAALKFLHGASLFESCISEMNQSMHIYSSTAKLCEFCAHEYEKSKDMAAAALAYKCSEVAYMRVIYFSHANASRDRHELQTALQIAPPVGESPSSSASDVDNLNNAITLDKVPLTKGVGPPQVAGNYVIAAQNRNNFTRLLNFAQDVNFAMEASRKARIAFAAANPRMEETERRVGVTSVKRALDFNFLDVEGLLRLVRLAMEAISR